MVFSQIRGTRNRREHRGRSNLGGAPAPPPPWRPWTRGGTLLPFRGRPRKKKKEGGSLPSLPVAPECHHHRDQHQHLRHLHQHLHHLPPSIYSWPLYHNLLYPLLEHGALCFILLSNDVFPSYGVWVQWFVLWVDWWSWLVWVVYFISVLSYSALHVVQAWGIPTVGCCNTLMIRLWWMAWVTEAQTRVSRLFAYGIKGTWCFNAMVGFYLNESFVVADAC